LELLLPGLEVEEVERKDAGSLLLQADELRDIFAESLILRGNGEIPPIPALPVLLAKLASKLTSDPLLWSRLDSDADMLAGEPGNPEFPRVNV
jgi:hypothetical protein